MSDTRLDACLDDGWRLGQQTQTEFLGIVCRITFLILIDARKRCCRTSSRRQTSSRTKVPAVVYWDSLYSTPEKPFAARFTSTITKNFLGACRPAAGLLYLLLDGGHNTNKSSHNIYLVLPSVVNEPRKNTRTIDFTEVFLPTKRLAIYGRPRSIWTAAAAAGAEGRGFALCVHRPI